MRVVVFGAGAVGGHLAARLAAHGSAAGIEVAAVARTSAPIHATDRPETLGRQDVVLVTLKSSVLPAAASQLQTLIGPETTVVFAMNGIPWWYLYRLDDGGAPRPDLSRLDPGGVLQRAVGLERVVGCMINSANVIAEPGVIRNSPGTKNRFTLGEPDGTISHRLQTISQAFERAGITAPMTATIRVDIWDRLLREGLAVCAAYGIHLDLDPERAYGARPTSTHRSSMLQDFERHRPPEIDGLLTAVQEFARAARIATPQLDAITALVIEKARRMGLYPS